MPNKGSSDGRESRSRGKTHSERISAILVPRNLGSASTAGAPVRSANRPHLKTAEASSATLERVVAGVWHWLSVKQIDRRLNGAG